MSKSKINSQEGENNKVREREDDKGRETGRASHRQRNFSRCKPAINKQNNYETMQDMPFPGLRFKGLKKI
jgi:hypothetical protein